MFFDDSLKGLKKELKIAGADISFVKGWQKGYDKVKKQYPVMQNQYMKAKSDLQAVMDCLEYMEQLLIDAKDVSESEKVLKKYQSAFNHEFLIGKEDKEFQLTFTTILALCAKGINGKRERLILQSEVENLMAITKEALEKEWPEFRELAYFYLNHTDRELLELPHSDKVCFVKKIYAEEFYNPMKQVVETALGAERAISVMEEELWI